VVLAHPHQRARLGRGGARHPISPQQSQAAAQILLAGHGLATRSAARCRPPTAARQPTSFRPSCVTVVVPVFSAVAFLGHGLSRQAMSDGVGNDELVLAAGLVSVSLFGAHRAVLV